VEAEPGILFKSHLYTYLSCHGFLSLWNDCLLFTIERKKEANMKNQRKMENIYQVSKIFLIDKG